MRGVMEEDRFSYDQVGNRLSDIANNTYAYNNGNELLNYDGISFIYDANGNMVSKTDSSGTTSYVYDSENRLIELRTPNAQLVTYKYDPFGRRIEKNVNGVITRYVYDREDILFELDGSSAVLTEYVHGPGIDEPIAMLRNNQTYYYHADGLGSIIAITNSAGQVVQRYEYNSFGEITYVQDPNFLQPYTYTGREYDNESGLYYYRARYYDAKVGRFITQDPIGFAGGINKYIYVNNRPTIFIDPTGLLCSYSQSTGNLTCTDDIFGYEYLSCNGYAGGSLGFNNPDFQWWRNLGPLPQGDYTVGGPNNSHGPFTRPLTPSPNNNMFGRNRFFIHGDNEDRNNTGSKGCIVFPRNCRERIPTGETLRVVP